MSKHSPAPWVLIDGSIKDAKLKTVAHRSIDDLDRANADARLICAAPDMLELLRLATETLALETRNGANYDKATHAMLPFKSEGNIDYETLVKMLRAAIAKSTGESE